ncbi:hypothetical protein HELRODRAFT_166931 [Helobdella robusta]|uniref:Endonuclease/exonuclease/phosphatase domain-containing protein n=1 Tax=Helobdella robusta TaxID=6412 RepID=T1EYR6_HELRO|nr:hypothetical protein HELRODRAFT_166931 [Helobdella robusta]ESO11856.1 hypothetical protein HELRODRAFT_166931 [Helobdella robusta]
MLKKITFHKKCSNELPLTFVNLYANEGKIYSEHPSPLDFIQYLLDHNALYAHNDSKIFCWFANYCAAQDCIRQTQFDDFIPTLKFFQSISCADEKVDCLELHDKELKSLSKENVFKMEDNHVLIIKLLKNINKQFKNKYDLSIFSSFLDKCSSIKWKEQDIDHCIFGTEESQISYTKIINSGDESTNLTCKTSSIPSNNYGNVESHDDASDWGGPLNEILHDGTVNIQTVKGIEEITDCDSDEERHLNEINQIKVHTHSKFENNKKDRNNNDIKIRAETLNSSTYHDAAANEVGHDFYGSKININDNISPTDFTILNSIDIEDKRSNLYLDGDSKLKTTHFIVNDENKDVDNNGLIFETELEPMSTTDITRASNDKNIFLSKIASPYLFKTIKVINNPMKLVVSHVVSPSLFWIHIFKNDLHENSSSPSSVFHKMSETADSIAECATSENQKVFLCNEMNKLSMDLKQNCEIVLNHGCLIPFSKDACLPNVPCLFNDVQEKIFYRAERHHPTPLYSVVVQGTMDGRITCRPRGWRFVTWSVGTLTGRSLDVVEELQRRMVDVAALQEIRWKGESLWGLKVEDISCGERGMMVREEKEEEKDRFYDDVSDEIGQAGLDEFVVLLGDLNGHVGADADGYEGVHGGWGYGIRNEEGRRVLELADAHSMVVGNTWFTREPARLITYRSGKHRSMIDYILARAKHRKYVKNVKAIPGMLQHSMSTRYVTGVVNVDWLPVLLSSLVDGTTKLLGVPRSDIHEFLLLAAHIVGLQVDVAIRKSGALHRARWMAKAICALKIELLFTVNKTIFNLTARELQGIQRLNRFIICVYLQSRFSCRLTADAPVNDILLIQRLDDYDDAVLGSTGLKMMLRHSWYMSPELATLALFSSLLSDKEKTDLVRTIQADREHYHKVLTICVRLKHFLKHPILMPVFLMYLLKTCQILLLSKLQQYAEQKPFLLQVVEQHRKNFAEYNRELLAKI